LRRYAVLTRLLPPHRASAAVVRDVLARAFPGTSLALPGDTWPDLLETLHDLGVMGRASCDAVIGLTAAHHGRGLLTLDLRARRTDDLAGVRARFLGQGSMGPTGLLPRRDPLL
jgi:predicted nucleic acid-binding protein